jgi:hypothetical protein
MELLIVGIVLNSLEFQSANVCQKVTYIRTLSNLEVWLMTKEAVIPMPDLVPDQ